MKKMQFVPTLVLMLVLSFSCKNDTTHINLRHVDKEQVINCPNENNELLNEALYQFEEDIIKAYDPENRIALASYGRFMYVGFSGTAEYERVASAQALEIRDALIAAGILLSDSDRSNLNYKHPALQCIFDTMEDQELSKTIKALIETNTMNPKLFNDRLRNFGRQASTQRYVALYVALESYYQQLVTIKLPTENLNE